jgi:hypothetical protein
VKVKKYERAREVIRIVEKRRKCYAPNRQQETYGENHEDRSDQQSFGKFGEH